MRVDGAADGGALANAEAHALLPEDGDAVLSARQLGLLRELADAVGACSWLPKPPQDGEDGGALELSPYDFEAFCSHFYAVEGRRKQESAAQSCWAWMARLQAACGAACAEFDALLGQLEALERQKMEVAAKTASLHRQCEECAGDHAKISASAEAIAQRLQVFDSALQLAREVDDEATVASLPSFSAMLDKLEASVAFLETHYDFSEARECYDRLEDVRGRACIAVKGSLLRALKRAGAQVEQHLWDEVDSGAVDTQVFYAPFQAVAPAHRGYMGLLHQRVRVHKLYLSTLEELERTFCALRLRLVGEAAGEHLCALRGTHPEAGQLASLVRDAGSYLLEAARSERLLFAAFFEARQPQDALQGFLEQLSKIFYEALQPAVQACSVFDALRETAECLQGDLLEPHLQVVEQGGTAAVAPGVLVRLQADVRQALLQQARALLRTYVLGFPAASSDLDYPDVLFAGDGEAGEAAKRRPHPSLELTLSLLSKTYRVLDADQFEALAAEAVGCCVSSLKTASRELARRPVVGPADPGGLAAAAAVRALDSLLFLIRHLLVLREQTAVLECDLGAGRHCAGPPTSGPHAALPGGFWAPPAAAGLRRLRAKRNGVVEVELARACAQLVEELCSWLGRPLLVSRAQEAVAAADAQRAFVEGLRQWLPVVAAHCRAYLGGPAGVLTSALRARLLALWAATGAAGLAGERLDAQAARPGADTVEGVLDDALAQADAMSWAEVRARVLQAPRAAKAAVQPAPAAPSGAGPPALTPGAPPLEYAAPDLLAEGSPPPAPAQAGSTEAPSHSGPAMPGCGEE